MPCGSSATGGIIGGVQNGPENGGAGEHSSSTTPRSTPNASGGGGTPNAIATISTDPAAPSPEPTPFSSRPPLPPPPRAAHCVHGLPLSATGNEAGTPAGNGSINNGDSNRQDHSRPWWRSWNRKYVLLCGMCGLSSVLLGAFYLVIYFVLRSYTSSLQFFQTMPTYVPACVLMVTGLSVLCFMRRKNRIAVLIKVVGFLCLVCAVVCVVVTVTTTVLHMNRLQTLSECTFYTRLHSCTCHPFTEEEPFELKLDVRITTCDVIHGPLYSCLRAMFGVSVIGILVSIFSCMLVYQLLSHEKKKMYWEQLENRRRFLYRRTPVPANNNCNCCDEYGFVPPSELYPWRMWDSVDESYWTGGTQLYSPTGEESSNASRSVLLGGSNPNGAPSLWLPWGGAWGANPSQTQSQAPPRDAATPVESVNTPGDHEAAQSEDARPQATGVLLRPFLPRGLEARFGLRRQPPPLPAHGGRRPLSDPGVALQLPRYPPPFSEAFLPPLPYEGLEAFSRLVWDPPPPYSQPVSQDSLHAPRSPAPLPSDATRSIATPARRPHALVDLMRGAPSAGGISSPSDATDPSGSPAHFSTIKDAPCGLVDTSSLPLDPRLRRLPLGHVKSLGDVTEVSRESLEALLCGVKEIAPMDKFGPHGDVAQRLLALKARHLKGGSDPRGVYGKAEQESELYFADVSSCVSLRQEDDKDDVLYYSEPAGPKDDLEDEREPSPGAHLYEQVHHHGDGDEDAASHHTSDDTMIVHTSSSDHSLGLDTENAYSVASPSSASPMATDTDAYSCYQAPSLPKGRPPKGELPPNLNLHPHHFPSHHAPPRSHTGAAPQQPQQQQQRFNDNECLAGDREAKEEPRYEAIPGGDLTSLAPSDLNGNVALSTVSHESPLVRQAQRTALTLPLRRILPSTGGDGRLGSPEVERVSSQTQGKRTKGGTHDRGGFSTTTEPNPSSLQDRRLHSVQDHLFALKSVNV